MAEGRRNSVDIPLSKTLVALKRVRSLRDPDTNSMAKYAVANESSHWDVHSCKDAYLGLTSSDKHNHHLNMCNNYNPKEILEDTGSNSDSDFDSSTVRIGNQGPNRANLVCQPYRRPAKKSVESSWVPHPVNHLDQEVNSYGEPRMDGIAANKKFGHCNGRKPSIAAEEAAMSRVGSPCISISEARTFCSGRSTVWPTNEDVNIADSSYSGCGIGYCWSRTPKYRDPALSSDERAEGHPLLSAEGREATCREIVPYPESPKSLSQKYKPRSFTDLVGLGAVSKSLLHAISKGKIAPVYLFHGPRGTGKTSTARIFAAALNCLSLEEHRPCGFCRECVFLFAGRSRDVKELDAVKINRKDRVKAILKSASLAPFSSHFKVFIVDDCQFLREETWSAIFSSVENLSRHSVFLMITTDSDKLPHSFMSLCQRYHFPKIKDIDICCRLHKICVEEGLESDKDALDFVATKCNGSLRDAEMILDQLGLLGKRITLSLVYELIGVVSDEELLDLLDLALSADTTNTVRRARDLMRSRVDPMQLVSQLANLIMDILSGKRQTYVSVVGKMHFGRHALAEVGMQKLRHALKVLSETEKQLRMSKNQATWLTVALLQFSTGDYADVNSSSPRDGLKNVTCCEDNCRKFCPGTHYNRTELQVIWRCTIRKCQSKSLKSFLQKEGNLSSIHVNEGLAVAEIEFIHPDHVSRAEKSWRLIATPFQHVLGCDVQLRLKLVPAILRKHTKVKKPSFSLFNCSGRNQQMSDSTMTEENGSETSSRRGTSIKPDSSRNGHQSSDSFQRLDSRPMQDVCFFHDSGTVIIKKVEDTRSSKPCDRCEKLNLQNGCKSKLDLSREVDGEDQSTDILESESQPNCFAQTLKLPRRFLSADAAQSICLRIQPKSKEELAVTKKAVSETYFSTHEPYNPCSRSNGEVTCRSKEDIIPCKNSRFSSRLLCWRPPTSSPRK